MTTLRAARLFGLARCAAAAIAIATCAAPAAHAADCPPSRFSLGGAPETQTTAAVLDTSINTFGVKHVAYDLAAGTVFLDQCCSLLATYVQTSDAFDVVGVPAGTPVALTAMLAVDGSVSTAGCGGSGCGGVFIDSLKSGAVADSRSHAIGVFNGSVPFHDDLSIPITIVAGAPVQIDIRFVGFRTPGGNHESQGTGHPSFTGMPAGVNVISCQGFNAGVTPTQRSSWGRVKILYR